MDLAIAECTAEGDDPMFFFYNFDASRRIRAAVGRLLRVPSVRFHHGKGGRSWPGAFLRELHFARTDAMLVRVHARTRREAVRRLVRGRVRSLRTHAAAGTWPALLAIALATLATPAACARAERRRRRPWDGPRLEAWLRDHADAVSRVRAWRPTPAPSRRRPTAAGSSPGG